MSAEDPALPAFADVPAPGGGFRLAVLPTTVAQYWAHLVDTGRAADPDPLLHGFPAAPGSGIRDTGTGLELDPDLGDLPVTWVTWAGAVAYCDWLGERLGTACGLPTEAEWRHAAGGPGGSRWALGDEFDRPVYAPAATAPRALAGEPANGYGLRGMTGNVFEWCADAHGDPLPGEPPSRVIKGGAYTVRNPESFENATVFSADGGTAVPYIGFRARSAPR
ncbi:formylglycine-generating enzyme family protein [Actinokineospora bangkokensis]|uniref:Sulfatase-modifying factor enzyme-like domain-containing protein n=1 Tax=Actinokineospora bangkokensis TaxID=1193682 RepID=A0A1Q9LRK3_9PSEU|nr:SUMF1/EgtB/PvdO family nonheme iron enzyme [Actinokineospora bangkokensis]OLR94652.1 hypothetical protein BJP25_13090 [Actinokineospora bangkokensis]